MKKENISHVRRNADGTRTGDDNDLHCARVAALTEGYASVFGFGGIGNAIGQLHDYGKGSDTYQQLMQRLLEGQTPAVTGDTTHAYAGALLAARLHPDIVPLLAYPILGHHTGLCDHDDMARALGKTLPPELPADTAGQHPIAHDLQTGIRRGDIHHIIRMLLSCLVDANTADTNAFMNPDCTHAEFPEVKETFSGLMTAIRDIRYTQRRSPMAAMRNTLQDICRDKGQLPPGIYTLTAPAGSGKTLASLLWATMHARKHGKKRIILSEPSVPAAMTRTVQMRCIYGNRNVCADYTGLPDSGSDFRARACMTASAQDWREPVTVTTSEVLFGAMLSDRPYECLRLHNLCDGIIIIRRPDTLPRERLQPMLDALDTYVRLFGTTVLLVGTCMPDLSGSHTGAYSGKTLKGMPAVTELVPEGTFDTQADRRTVIRETGALTPEDLAGRLSRHRSSLCMTQTADKALEVYSRLADRDNAFLLTGRLCRQHAADTARKVRALLDRNGSVILVATREAADLNLDFEAVYCEEAGLPDIIQAAGRCNREGTRETSETSVFSFGGPLPPGSANDENNARKSTAGWVDDPTGRSTAACYFRQVLNRTRSFDAAGTLALLDSCHPDFRSAAAGLRKKGGRTVTVNWKDSLQTARAVAAGSPTAGQLKRLEGFTVTVTAGEMARLESLGLLKEMPYGIRLLRDREYYDDKAGLTLPATGTETP